MSTTNWTEWDGAGIKGLFIFYLPGWVEESPSERVLLARSLREIGVTSQVVHAQLLSEQVTFQLSWYGYVDENPEPEVCDESGETHTGETVDTVRKCTFAVISDSHHTKHETAGQRPVVV